MNESHGFVQRGGLWVCGQFALMGLVIGFGPGFPGHWMRATAIIAGAGLLLTAAGFGIPGTLILGRTRTAYPRPRDSSVLVTGGIYARVRHPLYTSVMLMSFGWALLWQSRPALLAALVQVPFFWCKASREERWLREKFPDYAEYARGVPRFIPRRSTAAKTRP